MKCSKCGELCSAITNTGNNISHAVSNCCNAEIVPIQKHIADQFQEPHPGQLKVGNDNSVDSEQFQGYYHELPEYMTGGSTEKTDCVVGMPKRGDGKMYCNNCYALDNFKTLSGFQDYYSNKFLVYVCDRCGNVQMKVKDVEQIINVPTE